MGWVKGLKIPFKYHKNSLRSTYEVLQDVYRIFKNSANLFLYLLRWRKIEPSFLAQIPEEYKLAKEVKHILTDAVQYAENNHVEIILKQIAKYIEFKGDDIITGLTVD
jgi:hypothetical protein